MLVCQVGLLTQVRCLLWGMQMEWNTLTTSCHLKSKRHCVEHIIVLQVGLHSSESFFWSYWGSGILKEKDSNSHWNLGTCYRKPLKGPIKTLVDGQLTLNWSLTHWTKHFQTLNPSTEYPLADSHTLGLNGKTMLIPLLISKGHSWECRRFLPKYLRVRRLADTQSLVTSMQFHLVFLCYPYVVHHITLHTYNKHATSAAVFLSALWKFFQEPSFSWEPHESAWF